MCSAFLKNKVLYTFTIGLMMTVQLHAQSSFLKYFGDADDNSGTNIFEYNWRYYFNGYGETTHHMVFDENGAIIQQQLMPFPFRYINYYYVWNDTLYGLGYSGDITLYPTYTKIDLNNGTIIDVKEFKGNRGGVAKVIVNNTDGYTISVGYGATGMTLKMSFQKIDFYGNLLHFTLVGGTEGYDRILGMFPKKGSSDFLVFTQTELFTIDSMGVLKERRLHRPDIAKDDEDLLDVLQEPDGSFLSLSYYDRIYRHDTTGKIIYTDLHRFLGYDRPIKVTKTNDGGYLFANWDLFKLDSMLNLQWIQHLDDDITLKKIAQASDGGYYGCGEKYFEATKLDYFIFKTLPDGRILTGNEEVKNSVKSAVWVYPNPTTHKVHIGSSVAFQSVSVINVLGQQVYISNSNEIDISHLPDGIYYFNVITQQGNYIQRVLKN